MHTKPVCALQEWSLCFPQSCAAPALKPCRPSKLNALGLLLPMPDPRAEEPDVGLRTLSPVGEPVRQNYFLVCGSPSWWVWDLIISQKHPSYCFTVASSMSLDVEYLYQQVPVYLVDGCSEVSCDFWYIRERR